MIGLSCHSSVNIYNLELRSPSKLNNFPAKDAIITFTTF